MNNGQFEKDMSEVDAVLREVDGKEIGFWYKMDNYVDADMFKDSENTLHKSCMRDGEKADVGFFDLYITNLIKLRCLFIMIIQQKNFLVEHLYGFPIMVKRLWMSYMQ